MTAIAPGFAAEAHGVVKRFGPIEVLHGVDIAIPVGDARAIVGRNGAGKSTLVSLLTGIHSPNAGEIRLAGQPAPAQGDRRAWRERVACVYQRWMVIPHLTVAENLLLNNQPARAGLVSWRSVRDRAMAALADWELDVSPDLEAWRLTVEQRQIVEIARALLQGSRFIILDEPTAELERKEVNRLFDRIRALQDAGVTFLYISHHLEEIYEICRTVTVMRDGDVVADAPLDELPRDALVAAMVGPGVATGRRQSRPVSDAPVKTGLEIRDLALGDDIEGFNLSVAAGECVGLAGLAGSGKDRIAEAVAGLAVPKAGTIAIFGQPAPLGSVAAMRAAGVGYVARDRHVRGLFPQMSVGENLVTTILERLGRLGLISSAKQAATVNDQIRTLGIVATSGEQRISELSGGNQQKAMVGRALASSPRVLVLDAPTQGVDVASKEALYGIIDAAKARGMAVLLVSDDLDELSICDRVAVIFRGRITRSFARDWKEHDMVAAIEGLY